MRQARPDPEERTARGGGEPEGKKLRLFVAVELPDAVKRALVRTIDALKQRAGADAVRWVRPEGIHLTLHFLGYVPEERVPLIHTALRMAVRDLAPFDVAPGRLGWFGGRARLRVIWVGLADDGGLLAALAGRVQGALEPLGFPREERAFDAHVTLARVRDEAPRAERERLHDLLAASEAPPLPAFRIDRVSLMQSTLARGGAVYSALATYPLEGAAPRVEGT